jgi:hypothetical protein
MAVSLQWSLVARLLRDHASNFGEARIRRIRAQSRFSQLLRLVGPHLILDHCKVLSPLFTALT